MSSDGAGKSGIPSNEEVVEELTKDLRNSAIEDDSCADDVSRLDESDSENDTCASEKTETKDEDYIDEKLLKERDEQLPEGAKQVGIFQLRFIQFINTVLKTLLMC